ncbi:nuclear transport factor 2 family protein [Terrabacter sp. NPDC080008]|uniref:nuclear transport factor 2 family protein n=1 Tax=Terrabacter sp. NPDC080008 TaxID=3155176 RepID=UPI00344DB9BC
MRGGAARRRRWAAMVLAAVAASVLLLLTGSSQHPPWAEQALQWVAARDGAAHRSVAELVRFDSPRSVLLLCCNQRGPIRGRTAVDDFLTASFGDTLEEGTMGRSFVDVSGVVVEYRFPGDELDRPSGGGPPARRDEAQASEVDGDGDVTQTVHAASLQYLRSRVYDGRLWYGDDLLSARPLVDRYLAAWSGRDPAAVGALYADDATVLDSVLGVRLRGRAAIASWAAGHGGAPLRLDSVPGGGGPALYGYWGDYESHLHAYVAYAGDEGAGCPGGVLARLRIEDGRIVSERRYHDVASLRRCVDTDRLPDGWWAHARIPAPPQDQVTGSVATAGRLVELHNGTPQAEELVRWAMARFPDAGLEAPQVAFVAFGAEAHPQECTGGTWGLATQSDASAHVFLCLTVEQAATTFQRSVLLHELAHAWTWQNIDTSLRQQFVARMRLPAWDGGAVPWSRRGIEQAADVLAWGLSGDAPPAEELAGHGCADLTAMFRLLTGTAPLQPACPPVRRPG